MERCQLALVPRVDERAGCKQLPSGAFTAAESSDVQWRASELTRRLNRGALREQQLDDGVVAVAETRLPGAAGELVVRRLHTTIMKDPAAIDAAVEFIRRGAFPTSGAAASGAAGR